MSAQSQNGQVIQPYLEEIPKDAWGQELLYDYGNGKYPGDTKPAIWSSGPDMKNDDGGNDDITNWSHLTDTAS
jgi:general secretion pathway protein G